MNRQLEPNTTPSDASAQRSAVWTRHWATGAAHSCVGSYGDRYGGAIASFWKSVLAKQSGSLRVLDLATGNGPLPRLMVDLRQDLALEIDAVDLATIAPTWLTALPPAVQQHVKFHGGVALESLPFPDASFDLIVSQYGLEYSDFDRSVPELLRVLAPSGSVALLMHASDSRPVTLAGTELAHIEWLLSENGLLSRAAAMLLPLSLAKTADGRASLASDPAAEAARVQFNAAQATLAVRARVADGADVLHETQDAIAAVLEVAIRQGEAVARERVQKLVTALEDAQLRLSQLRQCAMSRQELDALGQTLRRGVGSNATFLSGKIIERDYLMGHTLRVDP
jgi:SAM-dependent methyltransferase